MRILCYNVWHGLAPTNIPWRFEYLEPHSRREARLQSLKQVIKDVRPDVLLLQEVNPLWDLGGELSEAFGYDAVLKEDIVGLKVLGLGLPSEIQSGLAIMTSPKFAVREAGSTKLSGAFGSFTSSLLSLQLSESRYALMAEWVHPHLGRVLVVNAHLHHGLEWTEELWRDLKNLVNEGAITYSQFDALNQRCLLGNRRRMSEVEVLLEELRQLKDRYSVILLGGDFNEDANEGIYQRIQDFGFRDCWQDVGRDNQGYTFDPETNSETYNYSGKFPLTVQVDDLSLSEFAHKSVTEILLKAESKPRRVDRLYMKANSSFEVIVKSAEIVGWPSRSDDVAPSDHFGLVVDIAGMDF